MDKECIREGYKGVPKLRDQKSEPNVGMMFYECSMTYSTGTDENASVPIWSVGKSQISEITWRLLSDDRRHNRRKMKLKNSPMARFRKRLKDAAKKY